MNYKELEVFKRAYKLAIEIHKYSLTLPKYLEHDIASQIRRASRSICSQIAEGYARNKSNKDRINFLNDALGSNEEMLFNLNFLKDTKLITLNKYQYFKDEYDICGKQLWNLIKYLKNLPGTSN